MAVDTYASGEIARLHVHSLRSVRSTPNTQTALKMPPNSVGDKKVPEQAPTSIRGSCLVGTINLKHGATAGPQRVHASSSPEITHAIFDD